MTTVLAALPYRIDVHPAAASGAELAEDARAGLCAPFKELPPKYFYDERGSELFERITELPEYYQARSELSVLRGIAPMLAAGHEPAELVELGSGASRKAEPLLAAMMDGGADVRYTPFDVCPEVLLSSASRLVLRLPGLRVHAVAGDFARHLHELPPPPERGARIVAFLGGTIGNLAPEDRAPFLREVADLLRPGDALLLGTDLAGDPARIVPAYDDAQGVTAEFNRNVLRVLNRELDADFDVGAFSHVARYDPGPPWIEMRLRSLRRQTVTLRGIDLTVEFAEGEEMRTEISCKFTREAVEEMYAQAGLELVEWHTDPRGWFAVSVAQLAGPGR